MPANRGLWEVMTAGRAAAEPLEDRPIPRITFQEIKDWFSAAIVLGATVRGGHLVADGSRKDTSA
ncbi:MAG: hypothetical protein ACJ79Q_09455 [Gemmatimonadaceae bacterium]|jgi:hypothetical protein